MHTGSVALILQAHRPYLRAAGRSYQGEEPLHELIATTVIPTLNTLHDLHEQRSPLRVGLAYSPILLDQLGDPVVLKHFVFWLDDWLAQLTTYAQYNHASEADAYQARFALEWANGIRHSFDQRFGRNLLGTLRFLCEEGLIEPLASSATFAPLNRLHQPTSLRAQIELGTLAVMRAFGKRPVGFWPPKLAYHNDATNVLRDCGMAYVVTAQPDQFSEAALISLPAATQFAPYLSVEGLSYSGDPFYLAPRRDFLSVAWQRRGLRGETAPYDPYDAYRKAQEHAEHFAGVLAASARTAPQPDGLQIVTLDAAVLGGHWFEGPAWLRSLFTLLAGHQYLRLTTPAEYLRSRRQSPDASKPTASNNGQPIVALLLHTAEIRFAQLARHLITATGDHERMLCQAARELLLAQASDNDAESATRTQRHLARCEQLCALAERSALSDADLTLLDTLEEEDNPFAELNFRVFAG